MDLPGLTHSAGQDVGDRQPQPFRDTLSLMMELASPQGGCLTPRSSVAADPVPSGVSWRMEGGVTCRNAVGRRSLVEGTGHLNCRRNLPKMILHLKAFLPLKQYPLPLKK